MSRVFSTLSILRDARQPYGYGLLLVLLLGVMSSLIVSRSVSAQDAAAEFGEAVPDAPAADAAPDAAPKAAADEGGKSRAPKTLLSTAIEALGWQYVIAFLLMSVTLVSLFVMSVLAARRDTLCPHELVESFEAKLNEKDYQAAYDLARSDESVLGQVLSAGLSRVSKGYNKAIEGMQEVGEEESMKLDHRLSYIALIGNLAPMVGLLGTVQGMVVSFDVIASSTSSPKPSELADGIAKALWTTLIGLMIAIPAIAAYNILRNRVARLLLEVGVTSENLMSRFEDTQVGGVKK